MTEKYGSGGQCECVRYWKSGLVDRCQVLVHSSKDKYCYYCKKLLDGLTSPSPTSTGHPEERGGHRNDDYILAVNSKDGLLHNEFRIY